MREIRFNIIGNNFNICKITMTKYFTTNNIIPNKIYYYSNSNFLPSNILYHKINKNNIFDSYHEDSIILLDFINENIDKNISNKIKNIKNIIIFSRFSFYTKDANISYINCNPMFSQNVFYTTNKNLENKLVEKYKSKYLYKPIKIFNNYDKFHKTEFLIENPTCSQDDKNIPDTYFELLFS